MCYLTESGASCLKASFSWGELSLCEWDLGQIVLFPSEFGLGFKTTHTGSLL